MIGGLNDAPGDRWFVPLDLVKRLMTPAGLANLFRASMAGARFSPVATVCIRGGHYVAEIEFETPIGPENWSAIVVMVGHQTPALVIPEKSPTQGDGEAFGRLDVGLTSAPSADAAEPEPNRIYASQSKEAAHG